MRNKGFTLIELLAVIVILAIIALIATPIILGIINDARKQSKQRTAELIAKESQLAYTSYLFTTNGAEPANSCAFMNDDFFAMDNGEITDECNEDDETEITSGGVAYTATYDRGVMTITADGLESVSTKLATN